MPTTGILLDVLAAHRQGAGAVIVLHQLSPSDRLGRSGFHGDRDQVSSNLSLETPAIESGGIGEQAR